jgi:hypothetical protein
MLSAEEFMFVLLAGGLTNCHRRLVSCSHWPHLHRRQEGFSPFYSAKALSIEGQN